MNTAEKPSKKGLYAAIAGTMLVALCCATPILVITLGAIGLSAFTPYIDYVLMPALFILILVAWNSYTRYQKSCAQCEVENKQIK